MAFALECDICGKLYKHYENENAISILELSTPQKIVTKRTTLDCCSECMLAIRDFLRSKGYKADKK